MRYFYDRDADSLYLKFAESSDYADSLEAAPGVVLDFDAHGRIIGLDLEHASKVVDVDDLALHQEPTRRESARVLTDGAYLKREREHLRLTQAELAQKLSVSANTIARWERGELKIEHPGMVNLALRGLQDNQAPEVKHRAPKTDMMPVPVHTSRTVRSDTGRFTEASEKKSDTKERAHHRARKK